MKVYEAINKVQARLAKDGISKDRKNTQGSGYMFRGIDDVYNALSPLLAECGLCILPRMIHRECIERQSKSGGALFYITVEAEFDFVGVEDGSKHTVRTFGEAMDSGDKATNKAMSAAYKYAAFQAFAIPTEGDNDADAQTHEVKPRTMVQKILDANIHPVTAAVDSLTATERARAESIALTAREYFEADDVPGAYTYLTERAFEDDDGAEMKAAVNSCLPKPLQKALKALATDIKSTRRAA